MLKFEILKCFQETQNLSKSHRLNKIRIEKKSNIYHNLDSIRKYCNFNRDEVMSSFYELLNNSYLPFKYNRTDDHTIEVSNFCNYKYEKANSPLKVGYLSNLNFEKDQYKVHPLMWDYSLYSKCGVNVVNPMEWLKENENSSNESEIDFSQFENSFDLIKSKLTSNYCFVGSVSGGSDSMCLMMLCREYSQKYNIPFLAVTIDHQLRQESFAEAQLVHRWCLYHNLNHIVVKIIWNKHPESKIQELSRYKRHAILTSISKIFSKTLRNKICDGTINSYNNTKIESISFDNNNKKMNFHPIILTAHNLNDNIETFVMRSKRSETIDSLAGISQWTFISPDVGIFRPLLCFDKMQIQITIAKKFSHPWTWDKSNSHTKYERNRIRMDLDSPEKYSKTSLEIIKKNIFNISNLKDKYNNRVDEICKTMIEECFEFGYISVRIDQYKTLDNEVSLRLILRIILRLNGGLNRPSLARLKSVMDRLFNTNKTVSIARCLICLEDEKIVVVPQNYKSSTFNPESANNCSNNSSSSSSISDGSVFEMNLPIVSGCIIWWKQVWKIQCELPLTEQIFVRNPDSNRLYSKGDLKIPNVVYASLPIIVDVNNEFLASLVPRVQENILKSNSISKSLAQKSKKFLNNNSTITCTYSPRYALYDSYEF